MGNRANNDEDTNSKEDTHIYFVWDDGPEKPPATLEKGVSPDPSSSDGWIEEGHALLKSGHPEEALGHYEEAIRLSPKCVDAWIEKGNALALLRRYEDALMAFEEATQLDHDCGAGWYGKGNVLTYLRRYTDGLIAYEKAIRTQPWRANPWNGKGNVLACLGRYTEALYAFQEAIRLDAKNALAWNGKGYALLRLGQYEEALIAFEEAGRLKPNDVGSWNGKAQALQRLTRYEMAIIAYDEFLKLQPTDAFAWTQKALSLDKLDRYAEALIAFEKAIHLNPHSSVPWCGKGKSLHEMKRYEEALLAFEQAIRLNPNEAFPWEGRGKSLHRLGQLEEAWMAFDKAAQLDPSFALAWHGKGIVLSEVGRYKEALEAAEQATRTGPTLSVAWVGKGSALGELSRPREGLVAFEEAIRLDPKEMAAWNGKGIALCELHRYEDALAAFREATRLDPAAAGPLNGKAKALDGLGRHEEALEAVEQAISLDPKLAISWMNMAEFLRAYGQLRKRYAKRTPEQCLRRVVFLCWPPRVATDLRLLRHALRLMVEDGGMSLLAERLAGSVLPDGVSLTIQGILRAVREEADVAHAILAWLEDPICPLRPIERLRLRGQVLLRFGDPLRAREVLDELDSTIEGERDLPGQFYLVWSLREYLEPYNKELDFAYAQALKWMRGEWGPMDQMACYYAGQIALFRSALTMARAAFERAGTQAASLLMSWHVATLMKDRARANSFLDLLFAEEQKTLREGRCGILFPVNLTPFDPNTPKGQDELQLVLRRFEISGALMDLLATENICAHPGYKALAGDLQEQTTVLLDFERYEHAVQTWRTKRDVKERFDRQQAASVRRVAEEEMLTHAEDFAILDVAPPCSLRGGQLIERLAQSLFQYDLAGRGERAMNVILCFLRQGRLTSEEAVFLSMYAYSKAYHDQATARATRVSKFVARTALETMLLCLLRYSGINFVYTVIAAVGGWTLAQKLAEAVQAVFGESYLYAGERFPTYTEFRDRLHHYWVESGDNEAYSRFFGEERGSHPE